MNSEMSEKRSMTESQKPPNALTASSSTATLPSMKSKMFATIMITPAVTNLPSASAQAAAKLMSTPMKVRMFGWIRSATQVSMMRRSGNMQIRPMSPVKVMIRCRSPRSTSAAQAAERGRWVARRRYNKRFGIAPKLAV